jgi:hypothetical protein
VFGRAQVGGDAASRPPSYSMVRQEPPEMLDHLQRHLIQAAVQEKDSNIGAVILVIIGLFFTPFLIGIPLLLVGLYKLSK